MKDRLKVLGYCLAAYFCILCMVFLMRVLFSFHG